MSTDNSLGLFRCIKSFEKHTILRAKNKITCTITLQDDDCSLTVVTFLVGLSDDLEYTLENRYQEKNRNVSKKDNNINLYYTSTSAYLVMLVNRSRKTRHNPLRRTIPSVCRRRVSYLTLHKSRSSCCIVKRMHH